MGYYICRFGLKPGFMMQRTIDLHISKLLFHHECVVVPSFGAFITRHHPAEVNPSTHMFRPAGKRLSFNARVNQNDGLLANYISKTEGIGYNEALESINISVRAWRRILRSGKQVNLSLVGRLYMDNEGNLQFNPSLEVNYDVHSFGLGIFRAPSVPREMAIEQGINKVIETHKKVRGEKLRFRPLLRWAAILTPLVALGIYTTTALTPLKQNGFSDFSSLFPFYESREVETSTEFEAVEPYELPVLEVSGSPYFEIEEPDTPEEKGIEEPFAEENSMPEAKVKTIKKASTYHIVVGSFKEKANALKYIRTIEALGAEPYIAEGNTNFHRVSVAGFTSRSKADQALKAYKKSINSAAWVYRN